jgi:hypothetical protein
MSESSPVGADNEVDEKENGRPIALGGLRRVYHQRRGYRMSKSSRPRKRLGGESDGFDSGSDEDDEIAPITQNTSNHYTLNMPGPAAAPSEMPYVLLG